MDLTKGPDAQINDVPCLDVVPLGDSLEVKKIFKALNIDVARVNYIGSFGINMVEFYEWDLSVGYKLSIMVATNDGRNIDKDPMDMLGYGVRIISK